MMIGTTGKTGEKDMTKEFEEYTKNKGYAKISEDITLLTAETAARLHTHGAEEDKLKSANFSEHQYWLLMDDGVVEGFDNLQDAMTATDRLAVRHIGNDEPRYGYWTKEELHNIFAINDIFAFGTTSKFKNVDAIFDKAEQGLAALELIQLIIGNV